MSDDTLTNLNWLQTIRLPGGEAPPRTTLPTPSSREPERDTKEVSNLLVLPKSVREAQKKVEEKRRHAMIYKSNPYVKPPYSYTTLICMAMRESASGRMMLSEIYTWVMENFAYYRYADSTWQNSVRHNLSLNKAFERLPRDKNSTGKGSFWRINPNCYDLLVDGIIKKRRHGAKNKDGTERKKRVASGKAPIKRLHSAPPSGYHRGNKPPRRSRAVSSSYPPPTLSPFPSPPEESPMNDFDLSWDALLDNTSVDEIINELGN